MTAIKKDVLLSLFPYLRITDLFTPPKYCRIEPVPGVKRWVPTYSGATALGLAARSLKSVGRTHLLVPSFNCGHEFEPFLRENFKVGMYRINRSGNVDMDHLEGQLAGRRQVVLVTHFFGFPQPIREIVELCQSKGVYVIEDCAHAFLSSLDGRPLGSWGDLSVFSYRKSLPSPDGGALVINNPDIPMISPSTRPSMMAVWKKTAQLIIDQLMVNTSRSSQPGYKMICEVKRSLLMMKLLMQKAMGKDSLLLYSLDDESYHYSSEILDWQISSLSLKVIGNLNHQSVRDARVEKYRYIANALKPAEYLRPLFPDLTDDTCPLGFPLIADANNRFQDIMVDFPYLFLMWDHFHPALDWGDYPDGAWLKKNCYFIPVHQDSSNVELDFWIDCVLEADKRLRRTTNGWFGAKHGCNTT